MATKIFKFSNLNPFRWTHKNLVVDPRYNTLPFDDKIDNNKFAGPYYQKWQTNDITFLQFLSDYDLTLKIYSCKNEQELITGGTFYKNISIPKITGFPITGVTYTAYEATVDFTTGWPEGLYYAEVGYDTNDPATITANLTEAETPTFIDGNAKVINNGVETDLTHGGDTLTESAVPGNTVAFIAESVLASTATHPRLRQTITKNGTVIYDHSVQISGTTTLTKTVIAQIGAIYVQTVVTEDNNAVVTPIDIADTNPVTPTTEVWQSSPLQVKAKHKKTLLYEYWDIVNTKGVIFSTGIKFNLRIEGNIRNFKPSSLSTEDVDQQYNTTTLDDIPYRVMTNFIGRAEGLPDWMIDKMNLVYSVKIRSIDGTFYNRNEGAKFEVTRPSQTENEDGYMSIDIVQQDNFFIDSLITGNGTDNEGDYVVIKQAKIFDNVGASFSVPGIFTANTNLIRLAIENKGADTFTLKVGTSSGDNDIAEFDLTGEVTDSLDIGHVFNAATDVFITIPNGVNLKVTFDYNQYDAVNISPTSIVSPYQFNTIYPYFETTPGDYDIHWSITGSGNVSTPFEGCALMGTNGLPDYTGAVLIGWDRTLPLERGQPVGTPGNNVMIDNSVLPDEGVAMFTGDINPTAGDIPTVSSNVARARSSGSQALNYEIVKGTPGVEPTLGLTAPLGAGDPLNITPYAFQTPFFVRLT